MHTDPRLQSSDGLRKRHSAASKSSVASFSERRRKLSDEDQARHRWSTEWDETVWKYQLVSTQARLDCAALLARDLRGLQDSCRNPQEY